MFTYLQLLATERLRDGGSLIQELGIVSGKQGGGLPSVSDLDPRPQNS